MKPINLLIITFCSSLTLFISSDVKAQINVQTGNTTIRTSPTGGINISTPGAKINTRSNNINDWDDYYFDEDGYLLNNYQTSPNMNGRNFRTGCRQQTRQTTQVTGSNRRTVQRSTSNCY